MSILTQQALEALYNSSGSGTFATNSSNNIGSASFRAFAKDLSDTFFALQNANPDVSFIQSEDFIMIQATGVPSSLSSGASGAGASAAAGNFGEDNTEHALGVLNLQTGTTTGGIAYACGNTIAMKFSYGHAITLKFRAAVEVLSDAGQNYTIYFGIGDTSASGAEPSNGAYFKYNHGTNSGKYQCVTANGGVRTATDSGVAQTVLYKTFEIRVASDATSVVFLIDGAIVATNTTNIPSGVAVFPTWIMTKSAGVTSRLSDIDWYNLSISRTSAR
jgi:hypothetical protein